MWFCSPVAWFLDAWEVHIPWTRKEIKSFGIALHYPMPEKIIPLGNLFSPNFGIFKVQGVVPWKHIQRPWGCSQRKVWSFSERSLLETCKGIDRTLATETLPSDVCRHGPKIDCGYSLCTMCAWRLCTFLGMEMYSVKTLAPRNLTGINLGTTPRRHRTRGYACQWSTKK